MASNPPQDAEQKPPAPREAEGSADPAKAPSPRELGSSTATQPLYGGGAVAVPNASAGALAAPATQGRIDTLRIQRPPTETQDDIAKASKQWIRTPPDSAVARAAARPVRQLPPDEAPVEEDPNFDPAAWERSFGEKRTRPLRPTDEPEKKIILVPVKVPSPAPSAEPAPPAIAANSAPANPWSLPPTAVASPIPAAPAARPAKAPEEAPLYNGLTPIVPSGPRAPSKKKIHPGAIAAMVFLAATLVVVAGMIVNKSASKEESAVPIVRPTAPVDAKPVTVRPDVPPTVATIAPRPVELASPPEPVRVAPPVAHEQAFQAPIVAREEPPRAEPKRVQAVVPPREDVVASAVPKVSPKPQTATKADAGLPDIDVMGSLIVGKQN